MDIICDDNDITSEVVEVKVREDHEEGGVGLETGVDITNKDNSLVLSNVQLTMTQTDQWIEELMKQFNPTERQEIIDTIKVDR